MRRSEAVSETRHFANLIINSVEEWQDHVAERPCPAFAAILLVATCHAVGSLTFTIASTACWLMLQFMVDFRPSCCRTWGYMAFAFTAFAAFMGSDASSRHHTPLFFPTHPPSFNISLHESDRLPPSAVHWPVLLLPSGSYAKLNVSAVDGSGNPRLLPTTFFLGPDDNHPWISEVGAATKPAGAAASTTAAPAVGGESFAASSRRRLRGFAMRGGFGGARIGGFTRGTGSFSSPHRGSSLFGSHRPISGTPIAHGVPVAHGVPLAHGYLPHTGFAGSAGSRMGLLSRPMMYHPPVMHDMVTGLAIAHVLRNAGGAHYHHASGLAAPVGGSAPAAVGAAGSASAFYFGAAAYARGTSVDLASAWTRTHSEHGCSSREACGLVSKHTLPATYDRYVLVSAPIRTPTHTRAGGHWPLVLIVHNLTIATAKPTSSAGSSAAALIGLERGFRGSHPPPEGGDVIARGMRRTADWILILLVAVALLGLTSSDGRSDVLRWNVRRGVIAPRGDAGNIRAPTIGAFAGRCGYSGVGVESPTEAPASGRDMPAVAADGEIVTRGTRVQTQWRQEDGGNGEWYAGTVTALRARNGGEMDAKVEYDDGEEWFGSLRRVYVLRDDEDEDEEQVDASQLPIATSVPIAGHGHGGGAPVAVGRRVR